MARARHLSLIILVALVMSLAAALVFGSLLAGEREREFVARSEWMAKNFADHVWLQRKSLEDPGRLHTALSTMVEEFVVMDPVIYAQIVLGGELVAQHQHLGDLPAEPVLALPNGAVPARRVERKRLENGLEYLDIWRAIEPGGELATDYVRLGVSLAPVSAAIAQIRRLAVLWAFGLVCVIGALAYLSWPWWGKRAAGSLRPRSALVIDDQAKEVRLNGTTLPLTPREYALIRLLASEPGKVFSAQEIIGQAWSTERFVSTEDVKKYIYLLRQKLERDPKNPTVLVTVRGFGYKLVPPPQ